jgi:type III secretory pathway component EscS
MSRVEVSGVCAAFAAVGGYLNYWVKVTEGRPFSLREVIVYTCVSAFAGFMAFELLDYIGFPPGVCAALCGMAGWMGTRLLRIGEAIIKSKTDVEKNDEHN